MRPSHDALTRSIYFLLQWMAARRPIVSWLANPSKSLTAISLLFSIVSVISILELHSWLIVERRSLPRRPADVFTSYRHSLVYRITSFHGPLSLSIIPKGHDSFRGFVIIGLSLPDRQLTARDCTSSSRYLSSHYTDVLTLHSLRRWSPSP